MESIKTVAPQMQIDDEIELASYAQNVARVNSLVLRFEREVAKEGAVEQVLVLTDEARSIAKEIGVQTVRALAIGGPSHPIYLDLMSSIERLRVIAESQENKKNKALLKLKWLETKRIALSTRHSENFHYVETFAGVGSAFVFSEDVEFRFLNDFACRLIQQQDGSAQIDNSSLIEIFADFVTWKESQRMIADNIPPSGPIDNAGIGGEDDGMEKRIDQLEKDMSTVKTDVAVMRSNYATRENLEPIKLDIASLKSDLSAVRANYATKEALDAVKADVAVIKSNYVTKEDLQTGLSALTWKMFGFSASLVAAAYFIAKYVH